MKYPTSLLIMIAMLSCKQEKNHDKSLQQYKNEGHRIVTQLVDQVGSYEDLLKKKDVVYTYTYQTPDGKEDISQEKYIFEGELSYGKYQKHERTFTDLDGEFEQGYDGKQYWLKHNGSLIKDEAKLKRVAFNRPTNFYWFAMFQKLLDPGVNYNHLGDTSINNQMYDKIDISFDSPDNKPTDIYRLFINQKTHLVDQFLFTVADFGVMKTPFLMQCKYENNDGMMIPSERKYKKSTWDAKVNDDPWIKVTWSDISFSNNLTPSDFQK